MNRFALIFGLVALFMAPVAVAQQASLKTSVSVQTDYILLGDLFDNAGKRATARIAYAPAPGRRAVFDAQWLFNVARANGLKWRPLSLRTRAVVERESQAILHQEVEDQLLAALRDQGVEGNVEIALANRSLRLFVPANQPATVGVEGLTFDPQSRRFTATVAAPAGQPSARRYRVTGRVYAVVQVPVLARRMAKSAVIRKNDITWIDVRSQSVGRNVVTEQDQIVGMAAKRTLRPGRTLKISDLRRPLLVPKGSLVTMELRTPYMLLSAQGRALDEGSKGDVIRVTNSQSKSAVEAVVIGNNRVSVRSTRRLALN